MSAYRRLRELCDRATPDRPLVVVEAADLRAVLDWGDKNRRACRTAHQILEVARPLVLALEVTKDASVEP